MTAEVRRLADRMNDAGRGRGRRRSAARKLAALDSPDSVSALAGAVVSADEPVLDIAMARLRTVRDRAGIDTVCGVWAGTRSVALASLLEQQGWVASGPARVRIMSALHVRRGDLLADGDAATARVLLELVRDDPGLEAAAWRAVRALRRPEARDEVCRQWVAARSSRLGGLLAAQGWVASRPFRLRVLTALRSSRFDVLVDADAASAGVLVDVAARDPELGAAALVALGSLRRPEAHDVVSRAWAATRSEALGDLLARTGWVAAAPWPVTLSALRAGRADLLADADADTARRLIELVHIQKVRAAVRVLSGPEPGDVGDDRRTRALDSVLAEVGLPATERTRDRVLSALAAGPPAGPAGDQDTVPVASALAAAGGLRRSDARDAICDLAVHEEDPVALDVAVRGGFRETDPVRWALLLFLAGDHRGAELDRDGSLLAAAHDAAGERLRARLDRRAFEIGRLTWIRQTGRAYSRQTGRAYTRQAGSTAERRWSAAVAVAVASGDPEQLWRLALKAPPREGVRLLLELGHHRWRPESAAERHLHVGLIGLAVRCTSTWTPTVWDQPVEHIDAGEPDRWLPPARDAPQLELVRLLVRWHRRFDIEIETDAADVPVSRTVGDRDVEVADAEPGDPGG